MGLLSNIKAALFPPDQSPTAPPAWLDRLQESKYVSSSYDFVFDYLDLTAYLDIKTSAFGNVDGDGVYMQHNGIGGLRLPMLMVLSGGDNDTAAKTALSALTERGDSTLYHPVFGPVTVVPTGEIQQINAFVTAANQTSFVVEFMETTGLLIADAQPYDSVLDTYLSDAAASFADTIETVDKAEEISLGEKIKQAIGKVKEVNDRLSNGVAATQSALDDTFDSINSAIDTLVKDPLMLARQVQRLCLTPAREIGLINSKLEAYKNLAADIFSGSENRSTNTYDNTNKNDFAVDSLVAGALTAGLTNIGVNATRPQPATDTEQQSEIAQANVGNLFGATPKKELIDNADKVAAASDAYLEWVDEQATLLGITNNSGDWQSLSDASSISVSDLFAKANEAQTEVQVTTTYERAAAAWCYEFYGSIKNRVLWFFQETNDLGGDEIYVIQPGRELVYYV